MSPADPDGHKPRNLVFDRLFLREGENEPYFLACCHDEVLEKECEAP